MMNDTSESGWQRLKDWLNRQWRKPGNPASAASPTVGERSDRPLADRVATWEDEGGAPAGSVSSVPAPPAVPKH
jgi:hypothetical protein